MSSFDHVGSTTTTLLDLALSFPREMWLSGASIEKMLPSFWWIVWLLQRLQGTSLDFPI